MQGQVIEGAPVRDGVSGGPLAPHINPFIEQLVSLGYTRATVRNQRSLVRTFDRWIADHHVSVAEVDEHVVDAFLDEPPSGRRRQRGSGATLQRLLTHLRAHGVTRPTEVVADDSPLAQLSNGTARLRADPSQARRRRLGARRSRALCRQGTETSGYTASS